MNACCLYDEAATPLGLKPGLGKIPRVEATLGFEAKPLRGSQITIGIFIILIPIGMSFSIIVSNR
jgi:hypothetical protein